MNHPYYKRTPWASVRWSKWIVRVCENLSYVFINYDGENATCHVFPDFPSALEFYEELN